MMQKQTWTLVTGGTGFVGSSFIARLLAEGHPVIAFSRSDADGRRTRSAVHSAARGFKFRLPAELSSQLLVIDMDYNALTKAFEQLEGLEIKQAWHVAAEMSYSLHKMADSFRSNVGHTCKLYQLLATLHPECERFSYCSTAYTQGVNAFDTQNSGAHNFAEVVNSYQASKWAAELNLQNLAAQHALPLTIFRPSVIIGHELSGWNGNSVFGPYGLTLALQHASRLGFRQIQVDLNPDARPNVIPINRVVDAMFGLAQRADAKKSLEFFSCAADDAPTAAEQLEGIGSSVGVKISFGPPKSLGDHLVEKVIKLNRPFMDKTWKFDTQNLQNEVPAFFPPYQARKADVDHIMRAFMLARESDKRRSSSLKNQSRLRSLLRVLGVDYRYAYTPLKYSDVKTLVNTAVQSRIKKFLKETRHVG